MEESKMVFLVAVFVAWAWNTVAAIGYWRKAAQLDLEAYKERPLIPDDKVAVMRPGDTVLLLLPLAGMTCDQQVGLVDSTKRMAERAGALGIEFIVLPDCGQKAIVVSRSSLPEHRGRCGADSAVI
ncbi:hypothetical protein [Achromobacter xylosoxidans]|uniref:hypothetical protein n=1 Tax=Alcaligenes xylosoxydans xylosoxydans TaxID=85698 RepID=UPI001F12C3ED|nr:hypothetical protein [Achromobacter xylosoxidans]